MTDMREAQDFNAFMDETGYYEDSYAYAIAKKSWDAALQSKKRPISGTRIEEVGDFIADRISIGFESRADLDEVAEAAITYAALQSQSSLIDEVRETLEWYCDQMCEGFCEGFTPRICKAALDANPTAGDCAGCKAALALAKLPKGGA